MRLALFPFAAIAVFSTLTACDALDSNACRKSAELACDLCDQDEYTEAVCTCLEEGTLTADDAPDGWFESDEDAEAMCFVWQTDLDHAGPDETAECKESVDIFKELEDDACDLGFGGGSGTTTFTYDTETPGGTNPTPEPPEILGWSGQCVNNETFSGAVTTSGDAGSTGLLNLFETGAPGGNGWNEEHDLFNGAVELTQVFAINDVVPGETTLFGCGPGEQFDQDETVLTYAVRVYDVDGNFADCIQFGHRPSAVANGEYPDVGGPPSNAAELRDCRTMN